MTPKGSYNLPIDLPPTIASWTRPDKSRTSCARCAAVRAPWCSLCCGHLARRQGTATAEGVDTVVLRPKQGRPCQIFLHWNIDRISRNLLLLSLVEVAKSFLLWRHFDRSGWNPSYSSEIQLFDAFCWCQNRFLLFDEDSPSLLVISGIPRWIHPERSSSWFSKIFWPTWALLLGLSGISGGACWITWVNGNLPEICQV